MNNLRFTLRICWFFVGTEIIPISNFSCEWMQSALKLSYWQLIPIVSLQLIHCFVYMHFLYTVWQRYASHFDQKQNWSVILYAAILHNKRRTTRHKQLLIISIVHPVTQSFFNVSIGDVGLIFPVIRFLWRIHGRPKKKRNKRNLSWSNGIKLNKTQHIQKHT